MATLILPALILLILVAGVGMVIMSISRNSQPDAIGDRLNQFTERAMTLEELELQQPFFQRVILQLARSCSV